LYNDIYILSLKCKYSVNVSMLYVTQYSYGMDHPHVSSPGIINRIWV